MMALMAGFIDKGARHAGYRGLIDDYAFRVYGALFPEIRGAEYAYYVLVITIGNIRS
jgi:hypothetical protein